jgi:predicted nicotinamide N-methyase
VVTSLAVFHLRQLFTHHLYQSFPPPLSYQLSSLKWIMTQVESHGHQVCEELYELFGSLVSRPQSSQSTDCYKSYLIADKQYITLKESGKMISEGTTGLTTWQAAFHFLEWALENLKHLNQRHVLELGSGAGLVGLSLCRLCSPLSYCFTDCHPHVLSLLEHNLHINTPGCTLLYSYY